MPEKEKLEFSDPRELSEAPLYSGEDNPKENRPTPVSSWEGYSLSTLTLLDD